MHVLLFLVGAVLVLFGAVDALWTTLWVDGNAGPMTRRHNSWLRRAILLVAGQRHRMLSLTGPLVLVASVLVWAITVWTGWALLFSADPRSLVDTHTGAQAGIADRIYFTGSTMFTLGSGEFTPSGSLWKVATAFAGLNGLFMLTLATAARLSRERAPGVAVAVHPGRPRVFLYANAANFLANPIDRRLDLHCARRSHRNLWSAIAG